MKNMTQSSLYILYNVMKRLIKNTRPVCIATLKSLFLWQFLNIASELGASVKIIVWEPKENRMRPL